MVSFKKAAGKFILLAALFIAIPGTSALFGQMTQDVDTVKQVSEKLDPASQVFTNQAAGEFTPGKGFQLVRNEYASLNLSMYGMARWVNQRPGETTWYDNRDSLRTFDGRNDIYWHRAMIWLTGFLGTPNLTYMMTVWTVTTTQQTLVYGNVQYKINNHIAIGAGITPNVCIRSIQGPFPFYASTDRTMAEESLR